MIVDTNSYILSLVQVLICCVVRDFLIPNIVWSRHLRNKDFSYRFWFCVITQACLQINLVLLLGFLNVCNRYTLIGSNIIIYCFIAWNYSDKTFFINTKEYIQSFWYAYKEDRFIRYVRQEISEGAKKGIKGLGNLSIVKGIREHKIESLLLGALAVYNIWFLTYNVMRYHCYQFSDIPVHQSWIYNLEKGILFSDGVYPFGMHAMVYFIRVIFNLNLREILLYAGAYQTVIMMFGIYILAKEIFKGKYIPFAAVLISTLMLNQGRYAASLPQESGMFAVVGMAYFMIRYLHADRKKFVIESDSGVRRFFRMNSYINRRYINIDAILFMLSVSLVIAYHFYTAIAAIFMVLAIGLAYLPRILKKQYFIPIVFSGLMGALIAVVPFGACLAKGIPFQESMAWATSVIAGEEWKGSDTDYQADLAEALGNEANVSDGDSNESSKEKVDYSTMTPKEILEYYYRSIFGFGILVMFPGKAIQLMFLCMLIGFIMALFMLLYKKTRPYGHDYMALIIYMILLCTVGASQQLGIIEIIAADRASTFAEPFIGLIYMMPVDFIFRMISRWENRYYQNVLKLLTLIVCGGAGYFVFYMGWYHDFFDVNQAYYNESEYVLRHIKKSYPKHSYTIVSTTDEYYEVLDYGFHTQLSEFINMVNGNGEAFTFTTEYVFFFIEKQILQDYNYGPVEVSLEYAEKDFVYLANTQDYYFQRAVIESQAYYWAKAFQKVYPRDFYVFYEDDIYMVYIMKQNTYNPYGLQIDYLTDAGNSNF